jgi:hypothetical protein
MSSTLNDFPAPFRHAGRLVWDRHDIENYKRSLMHLPPVERDPRATIVFVTAKQLADELPYGRRTLGRRVKGRIQDDLNRALATA